PRCGAACLSRLSSSQGRARDRLSNGNVRAKAAQREPPGPSCRERQPAPGEGGALAPGLSTVTSWNGSAASTRGNTNRNRTATAAAASSALHRSLPAMPPGKVRQSQPYTSGLPGERGRVALGLG